MITINFLGPINKDSIQINANTINDVKNELNKIQDLQEWLEISAIAVNDDFVSDLDFSLKDGDVISILPPVCGG